MEIILTSDIPEEVRTAALNFSALAAKVGWKDWEFMDLASRSVVISLRAHIADMSSKNRELVRRLEAIQQLIPESLWPDTRE